MMMRNKYFSFIKNKENEEKPNFDVNLSLLPERKIFFNKE